MFGRNAHAIYTIVQNFSWDSYQVVSDEYLTDGANDKSCDFVIINLEDRLAAIVQAYYDDTWSRGAAEAKKASDLNQAVTWLLSVNLEDVPKNLRIHATELRRAISEKEIDEIHLLYIHNCPESANCKTELEAAEKTLANALNNFDGEQIETKVAEIGLANSLSLFSGHVETLAITEDIGILGEFGLEQECEDWKCFLGTITGTQLRDLYNAYGSKLFAPNVREYLGSRKSSKNINNNIIQSAASEPQNFYVYNNGVTFLTKRIDQENGGISCSGLGIINGAQTTGAINEATGNLDEIKIMCRIIQCNNTALVEKIVQFTNTQNAIKAADRKSNDPVQNRLDKEFADLGFHYKRRRGVGRLDNRPMVQIEEISQSLASFHGQLTLATRNKTDIFEAKQYHDLLFKDDTSASHLLLIHSLSVAISSYKSDLKEKPNPTTIESRIKDLLDYSSGKQFTIAVIGSVQDALLDGRVSDQFHLRLKPAYNAQTFNVVRDVVKKLVSFLMPLILSNFDDEEDLYNLVRSQKQMEQLANRLAGTISALRTTTPQFFDEYKELLVPLE